MRIFNRIKICSKVGFHAWYESSLGYPLRKPIGSVEGSQIETPIPQESKVRESWWLRFINFIKSFIKKWKTRNIK